MLSRPRRRATDLPIRQSAARISTAWRNSPRHSVLPSTWRPRTSRSVGDRERAWGCASLGS